MSDNFMNYSALELFEKRFRFTDMSLPLISWLLPVAEDRLREQLSGKTSFALPIESDPRSVMPQLSNAEPSILCIYDIDSIVPKVKLPSLPQVFYRVQELVERDDVTMDEMEQAIRLDPRMTCSLLKMANGGLFNAHAAIDTLSGATEVLRNRQVSPQTLGTLMLGLFLERPSACLNIELFWQHSFAVGIVARALAKYAGREDYERYFVAGLVHDVGWLALTCTQPEMALLALEKAEEWQCPFAQAERRVLGFDHSQLGARLLESWSFPAGLVAGVEYHHEPSECAAYSLPKFVHIADVIVKAIGYGASADCLVQPLDGAAWESLGLEPEILAGIISTLDHEVSRVSRSLCMRY